MCYSPITIKNKEWQEKDSGKIYSHYKVPCGKCFECVARRKAQWTFRLEQEALRSTSCSFITLTYDDDSIKYSDGFLPTLEKRDLQLFFKRLRQHCERKLNHFERIKYYACGEYGDQTQRPHYHAIIYNLPLKLTKPTYIDANLQAELQQVWQNQGAVHVLPANTQRFAYTAGYVQKKIQKQVDIYDDETGEIFERDPEFSIMSKRLGDNFITPQMARYLKENMVGSIKQRGYIKTLPRYYKDKIFTGVEKEMLAIKAEEYYMLNEENNDPWVEIENLNAYIRNQNKRYNRTKRTKL